MLTAATSKRTADPRSGSTRTMATVPAIRPRARRCARHRALRSGYGRPRRAASASGSATFATADGWIELTGSWSQRWVPATGFWKNAAKSPSQVTANSGKATFQLVSLSRGMKVAASIAAEPSSTATSCRKANSYSQMW